MISNSSGQEGPPHQKHSGHIPEKGYVSEFHYNLVHKPISIKETLKVPEANEAVAQRLEQA